MRKKLLSGKVKLWMAAVACFGGCVAYITLAGRAGSTIANMATISFPMLCGAAFFAYEAVHHGRQSGKEEQAK